MLIRKVEKIKQPPGQYFFSSLQARDVNVLIFPDFSFRYDSVHQKYKKFETLRSTFYGIE